MGAEVAEVGGLDASGFDRLLEQTRQALASVRLAGTPAEPGEVEMTGVGAAADGQVRATVLAGGRLESLQVNPRLLRNGIESVCEQIIVAVNAALDDLRDQAAAQGAAQVPAGGVVDPAALAGRLRELQDQSVRQMAVFSQAMNDVVAQLRGR